MLTFLITAITFLLIFSLLILIHEWGHFYAARKNNIKVEEFGFGLPPRLWGFKKGETLYSLNAIPFGGFVKLLGEDAHDPKARKNPRSFASKPIRVRILVVVAGVLMNFLLAFVLLTIGFIVGIQPMIVTGDDLFQGLQNGTIHTEQGILVKKVEEGSPAEISGLRAEDKILTIQGRPVISSDQLALIQGELGKESVLLSVERKGEISNVQIVGEGKKSGLALYENIFLPRLQILAVDESSPFYSAGLRSGDIVWKINNQDVYTFSDYQEITQKSQKLAFTILREQELYNYEVLLPQQDRIVVSAVYPLTPAEETGFEVGDLVVSVDNKVFGDREQLVSYISKNKQKPLSFTIKRNDSVQEIQVTPDGKNGRIGVGFQTLFAPENYQLALFPREVPVSVTKIDDVRYPFWYAPIKALEESGRLAVISVQMFGNVIRSLVVTQTVPEGVSGPVGIAQMTQTFVQEGVFSLMRFVALLSLSLAIMNVLPFPALDGGRLFFILLELVLGKRVNSKYEALIHTIGFILLLLLIGFITYSDILRIF